MTCQNVFDLSQVDSTKECKTSSFTQKSTLCMDTFLINYVFVRHKASLNVSKIMKSIQSVKKILIIAY